MSSVSPNPDSIPDAVEGGEGFPSPVDDPVGDQGDQADSIDMDVVPTGPRHPAGIQPPHLRRGTELARLRGRASAMEVREMLIAGQSVREIAKATGLSRRQVIRWRRHWVAWSSRDPSREEVAEVRAALRVGLRAMYLAGMEAFRADPGGAAAAGAVALRAGEALERLHGLGQGIDANKDQQSTLAQIAASVRGRAGLLSAVPSPKPEGPGNEVSGSQE